MIPVKTKERVVHNNSNVGRSMNFRLEAHNLRHIVTMLRDSVYSDKIKCIIREYASNALDAHAESEENGLSVSLSTPIEVHLPTKISSELKIRDYGRGLSTKEIEEIYISLGESTKRTSNKYVGSLGFGCKSAFAYGDRFTVTSWNGGHKIVYNNVLDDNVPEGARCDIMANIPCNISETGIEICIPIRQNDVEECKKTALDFFKYWKTFPKMTGVSEGEIEECLAYKNLEILFSGNNWKIYPPKNSYGYHARGVALMGDVPYTLDWSLIEGKLKSANSLNDKESILFEFLRSNDVVIDFEIGELEFAVSRESLQYTDYTCSSIMKRIREILFNIKKIIEEKITSAQNLWEAKRLYGIIFSSGVDKESEEFFGSNLYRLAGYFKDKLKWNNIVINGPSFMGLESWIVGNGKVEVYSRVYSKDEKEVSILTTYANKYGKIHRKNAISGKYRKDYTSIVPSKKSMVLINDLGSTKGLFTIIRYLLRENNGVSKIYCLNFGDDKTKKEFYKEYNFYSVPTSSALALLNDAKKWYASVKVPRTSSVPTGIRIRTYSCNKTRDFLDHYNWRMRNVELKLLDKKNYYVPVNRDNIITGFSNPKEISAGEFSRYINSLSKTVSWFKNIDILYGIPPRTQKANWFQEAEKKGTFINLFTFIFDNIKTIEKDKFSKIQKYNEYLLKNRWSFGSNYTPNSQFAIRILGYLEFEDGELFQICKELSEIDTKFIEVITELEGLGFSVSSDSAPPGYSKLVKEIHKKYPLLDYVGRYVFRNNTTFDEIAIQELAKYVNRIDLESGCKVPVKKS